MHTREGRMRSKGRKENAYLQALPNRLKYLSNLLGY